MKGTKAKASQRSRKRRSSPVNPKRCFITGLPNELLQGFVLGGLSFRDGVSLARTSKEMRNRVLSQLYKNDAHIIQNGEVPFALQWACYFGSKATAEASISAIEAVEGDVAEVVQRQFSKDALHTFAFKRNRDQLLLCSRITWEIDPLPSFYLLNICCLGGHTAIADILIRKGARINGHDGSDITALHSVLNPKVARFLVDQGAKVNARDSMRLTPLMAALGRHKIFFEDVFGQYPPNRQVRFHVARGGNGALEQDHTVPDVPATIRYLIQAGSKVRKTVRRSKMHSTVAHPLQMACLYSDAEILQLLLDSGANPNPFITDTHQPYLVLNNALFRHRADMVRMLLDAGALVYTDDHAQTNPIRHMIDMGLTDSEWMDIADIICRRSKRTGEGFQYGRDDICMAMKKGQWAMVKLLIRHGASWDNQGEFIPGRSIQSLLTVLNDNGQRHGRK